MRQVVTSLRFGSGMALVAILTITGQHVPADDAPAADSPLVKLLRSGRVPESRQGAVIEMIGKRGTTADLTFVFQQTVSPRGFSKPLKIKALVALAEAASNRGVRPEKDRDQLVPLIETKDSGPATGLEKAAVQLAGIWKLDAAAAALRSLAVSATVDEGLRNEALSALAAIGGPAGRGQITALTGPDQPIATRMLAVAALVKLDINAAATRAVEILKTSQTDPTDLTPLLAAFLNRQGGADVLAAAISQHAPAADAAKLALRSVYALGRADPTLVAALSLAAGLSAETKALSPAELNQLVADVAANGDPARGERVFRRADLNCMSCHALSKAGGEVGPDLSSIGQTSPPDYIINSILNPDQAIKEQYHTLVVQTSEGQVFQGIVTDKDEQRVVLKEATGAARVVPTASIEEQKPGGSLMPKGLANLMTRPEFVDLVRFLSELGKPGPYAIRSIPTIQRWRVLKASGQDTRWSHEQVRKTGAAQWAACYAKVAGGLPLADVSALSGAAVSYIQGEINVSSPGPVRVQLDSPQGVQLWVDDEQAPAGSSELVASLSTGRHAIMLRIDTTARKSGEIKVQVTKPAGSAAEFTVVGGH